MKFLTAAVCAVALAGCLTDAEGPERRNPYEGGAGAGSAADSPAGGSIVVNETGAPGAAQEPAGGPEATGGGADGAGVGAPGDQIDSPGDPNGGSGDPNGGSGDPIGGSGDPIGGSGDPIGGSGDPVDSPPQDPTDDPPASPPAKCEGPVDPGRVTLHRLNRAEYDNTMRDLLDDMTSPAANFPADDVGYGFDNIADVLSVSPLHVEKFASAAQALIAEALAQTPVTVLQFEGEALGATAGAKAGDAWNLYSNGSMSAAVTLPDSGTWVLSVQAWAQQAGAEPAKMTFSLDGALLATVDVPATVTAPGVYEHTVDASAGPHTVKVAFINDYNLGGEDRNLFVDWVRVEGPVAGGAVNPIRAQIMTCSPAADGVAPCAAQVVRDFAHRAWRRPPSDEEVARYGAIVEQAIALGGDFEEGIRAALEAVLLSPHLLYRVELDPSPGSTAPHPLTGLELASRLSYLLWSSMPDAELLAAADTLQDPAVLEAQVLRMVDDPRAEAITANFAGQWLLTRAVDSATKDPGLFPGFDPELRAAMKAETGLFFDSFLHEDRSALDMLDADFTWLNARLAEHYGLPAPAGPGFERVPVDGAQRGGLLTQASILTVTSHPNRTSPVKRGKWVLGQLLCMEPPPPPANVTGLVETTDDGVPLSAKELMAKHTTDPVCAGCHTLMEPIGFALENYDAVGAWRTEDAGQPIDPAGTLFTGAPFADAHELALILKEDPATARCMVDRLLTYALGRGLEASDSCSVDAIAAAWAERGHRMRDLFVVVALSDPFRMRRGEVE